MTIRLDLLEIFGSGYVVDHCVAVFAKKEQEKMFRSYLADSLMAIANNTAGLAEQGQVMTARLAELMSWVDVDERTGDEIALDIINRAGLRMADECL